MQKNTYQQPEICKAQLKNANDPQKSAELWHETSANHEASCRLQGATPQVTYANGGDRWLHWLEINFA